MNQKSKKPAKSRAISRLGMKQLSQSKILDAYFIENRTRLTDIAAFLDRFDRSEKKDAEGDFRRTAFQKAVKILLGPLPRTAKVLLSLSDTSSKPLKKLDRKNALGAFKRD